jgi:hypothetical protein
LPPPPKKKTSAVQPTLPLSYTCPIEVRDMHAFTALQGCCCLSLPLSCPKGNPHTHTSFSAGSVKCHLSGVTVTLVSFPLAFILLFRFKRMKEKKIVGQALIWACMLLFSKRRYTDAYNIFWSECSFAISFYLLKMICFIVSLLGVLIISFWQTICSLIPNTELNTYSTSIFS